MHKDAEIEVAFTNSERIKRANLDDAMSALASRGLLVSRYHLVGNLFVMNAIELANDTADLPICRTAIAIPPRPVETSNESTNTNSVDQSESASALVFAILNERALAYCPPLSAPLRRLFDCLGSCSESPEAFAAHAGISRRTLDRYVSRAGIKSTRLLFAGARVCVAFSWIREHSRTKRKIGQDLGCASFRPIERQCRSLTGLEISSLERTLSEKAFAEMIASKLLDR